MGVSGSRHMGLSSKRVPKMFERAGRARTGCGTEMVARKNVSKIKKLAGGFVGESRGGAGVGRVSYDRG